MSGIQSIHTLTMELLDARLRTVLPEDYQECYEEVQPVSMGSAGLKYGPDGKVAWDDMWESFCDLAMAGGPPHKGKLLEPGSPEEIAAGPESYAHVIAEIRRGIQMVALLPAKRSSIDGWVAVDCSSVTKAGWLVRAIAMENISVRCSGSTLELPAGPGYRVEKEIKNVVTAIAKTCHYWDDHMPIYQQAAIRELFQQMDSEAPFVRPALAGSCSEAAYREASCAIAVSIRESTGLNASAHSYYGWLGVDCVDVRAAVWMMRALVACNLLSRREGTTLFVPVDPCERRNITAVIQAVVNVFQLARERRLV